MPKVSIQWLTARDITSQEACKGFLAAMFAHIPDHLPSVCGFSEPLRTPFSASDEVFRLWPEPFVWANAKSHDDGDVQGDVGHGKYWHTCVSHAFKTSLPLVSDPLSLLRDAGVLFQPDFACAHVFGDGVISQEDDLLHGIVSKDLQTGLPPIPWACCFGPCYVNLIGRSRIESAGFWMVEELGSDLLYCQSVQHPEECLLPGFQRRRDEIKRAMGQEFFLDSSQPTKRAVTPAFKFLRSRTLAADG